MNPSADAPPRAAYLHVPFCRRRCGYCNFTIVAGRDEWIDRYLAALQVELDRLEGPWPADTVFWGGGTPSHLPLKATRQLLEKTQATFPLEEHGEWTVEANPEDVDRDRCALWQAHGVTRVSLGVQSFQREKLAALDRVHTPDQAAAAVALCRRFGFTLSLDLIFAAPGESLSSWCDDLNEAVRLAPEHLSVYGLTIERGSPFYGRARRDELPLPAESVEREMYLAARHRLRDAGYEHYEISNYATPGFRCRHNETYWVGRPYFAAGPGAASFVAGVRRVNHGGVLAWMRRIEEGRSPVVEQEQLAPEAAARERLVLGLRRLEGVDGRAFRVETGFDIEQLAGDTLREYADQGWLACDAGRWRLTEVGILISDSLWHRVLVPGR